MREAQTMRQQAHPNILPLHCSFVHGQVRRKRNGERRETMMRKMERKMDERNARLERKPEPSVPAPHTIRTASAPSTRT